MPEKLIGRHGTGSKPGGAAQCQFDSDLGRHLPIAGLELRTQFRMVISVTPVWMVKPVEVRPFVIGFLSPHS